MSLDYWLQSYTVLYYLLYMNAQCLLCLSECVKICFQINTIIVLWTPKLAGHVCPCIGWVISIFLRYKAILGKLPSHLCKLISQSSSSNHYLRSQDTYLLCVPNVQKAFMFSALDTWNSLQRETKFRNVISQIQGYCKFCGKWLVY